MRADSGFCRWQLLSWCERNDIGYIIGLAKNAGLVALVCDVGNRFALEPEQNLLPVVPEGDRQWARFPVPPERPKISSATVSKGMESQVSRLSAFPFCLSRVGHWRAHP